MIVSNWKQALLQGAEFLFAEGARPAKAGDQPDPAELFEQIGLHETAREDTRCRGRMSSFRRMANKSHNC